MAHTYTKANDILIGSLKLTKTDILESQKFQPTLILRKCQQSSLEERKKFIRT